MPANVPPGCSETKWDDFCAFADALVATGDLDPASSLLAGLANRWGLTVEEKVRLVLLWIAYDEAGSVLSFWDRWGFPGEGPVPPEALALPTSMERRGHRSPLKLRRHLEALGSRAKWAHYLGSFVGPNRQASWIAVTAAVRAITGNGRWSAFKAGEMLVDVAGFPMEAPDCQHADSSGPRQGLGLLCPATAKLLGSKPPVVARLDAQTDIVRRGLEDAVGYKVPMHHLESTLCDYQGLVKGRYYLGHDIELQRTELDRARQAGRLSVAMSALATSVRAEVFPPALLAEAGALDGRGDLRGLYRQTGRLIWWDRPVAEGTPDTPTATWGDGLERHVGQSPRSDGVPSGGGSREDVDLGCEPSPAKADTSPAR